MTKKLLVKILIIIVALGAGFLLVTKNNIVEIDIANKQNAASLDLKQKSRLVADPNSDIAPQKPLENPPEEIKAIYSTAWSAGNEKKVDYFINFIKSNGFNAIVIDVKDYSGYIAYDIKNADVEKYGAKKIKIPKINKLIKRFHDEEIYVIARITVFQDSVLAKARPDLAVHNKNKLTTSDQQLTNKTLWLDRKKLAWIDPTNKEARDYNIAIAKDAAKRGFDELNFDYIRFPSDGNLRNMMFPYWRNIEANANSSSSRTEADKFSTKSEVIKSFFEYLRESLPGVKISADLFGLTTINKDDLGIGQIIEDAYKYFDYVAPMLYPSHYAPGFNGYKNPAEYPYEVVKYSLESALNRLKVYNLKFKNASSTETPTSYNNLNSKPKLRPWLQDFNLGADYNAEEVKAQIKAVYDAASSTPELINGWMLWNPANIYTRINAAKK